MSDDRQAQVRAEAERRQTAKHWRKWEDEGEHLDHSWSMGFMAGFREGAEWADAHPDAATAARVKAEALQSAADTLDTMTTTSQPGVVVEWVRVRDLYARADLIESEAGL